MSASLRILLIHATRVAMEPIETAFARLWPEAKAISILDEGLASDRAEGAASPQDLDRRIVALCRYAESLSPSGIIFTCSSFGAGIEEAARTSPVPVLKPNEAMFETALDGGQDIVMLYTFPPAAEGMTREFDEAASLRGRRARLRSILVNGALDALKAGDGALHDALIADAAEKAGPADAIMLAQFSMASAASAARQRVTVPVLTSPDSAVEKLRRSIQMTTRQKGLPC